MRPKSAAGDWVKQLKFDMAFAEKTLIKNGSFGTMFVVHTKDRTKHAIGTPWRDEAEKAAYLEMITAYCTAHNAEALSCISEAWIRHLQRAPRESDAEFQARIDAVRPPDAEDRIEVVGVMIMYRDDAGERQVVSDAREIERRANGKPTGLKPFRLNEGRDVLRGEIVEAFPQWPPDRAEQIAAQMVLKVVGMVEG